jgi:hypothetical protein
MIAATTLTIATAKHAYKMHTWLRAPLPFRLLHLHATLLLLSALYYHLGSLVSTTA